MTRTELLDRLERRVLIADGAMGTLLHERGVPWNSSFEDVNRTAPEVVLEIHREYVAVGCELIETNTFQANRISLAAKNLETHFEEINRAGVRLARQAAGTDVLVAGSMGPIPHQTLEDELTAEQIAEVYHEQATILADEGVDLFILETFTDLDMLVTAMMAVRKACGDLPIVCEMAFTEYGRSGGEEAITALMRLEAHGADVVGGNCGSGPTGLLPYIKRMAQSSYIPLSAMPNTSYPQYVDGRYIFLSTPEYIAERAGELLEAGANIIGGCCGTTPAHLKLIVERFKGKPPAPRVFVPRTAPARRYERVMSPPPSLFEDAEDHTLILVEMDPPKGMDYAKVIEGAQALQRAGIDALTTADNSLATIRLSAFVMGHLVQKETGLPVIVHWSCRDRNLIGQQSALMGAAALGIRYILAVTGDPASMANIGASSVYDTNSIGLIKLIVRLNRGENLAGASIHRPTEFVVGCALDPSGAKLDGQLRRLHRKVEAGAQFVMTQPLYDPDRIHQMYERVRAEFDVPVFVGIMPLVSRRNAEFLHNEVPGIRIPAPILERMRAVPSERAKDEGIAIAAELVEAALEAGAPGIYLIPPFGKYDIALKLIPIIKQWDRMHRVAVRKKQAVRRER